MKTPTLFGRLAPKWLSRIVLIMGVLLILTIGYRYFLPIYRVRYHSELVMLGDFNGDHRWDAKDRELLAAIVSNPFSHRVLECAKADVNNDGTLDAEDLAILEQLFTSGDPYTAEAKAIEKGLPFPRPRELYRYMSAQDYVNRPLYALARIRAVIGTCLVASASISHRRTRLTWP